MPVDSDKDYPYEYIECIESLENLEEAILESEKVSEIRKAVAPLMKYPLTEIVRSDDSVLINA